ncbi:autotransporter outer membrane beta-barrel domain-containing protein [Yersinia enterocolitica]|uniref:autotransporter outer membrane beta-barrel domain-containing protein n=1 Tax=Yersinia enterocolitica TaxID=630 RepID=UPI00398D2346
MENINNLRKYILKTSIPKQVKFTLKKSPIAKFVASVLFILGSSSGIAKSIDAVGHQGAVNKNITLNMEEAAQQAKIIGPYTLKLTDIARANKTQVNTKNKGIAFYLADRSRAYDSEINHGRIWITDDAKAFDTFVGCKALSHNHKNALAIMDIKRKGGAKNTKVGRGGTINIFDNGRITKTDILENGIININNNGIADDTIVHKGGVLVIKKSESNNKKSDMKLINTVIEGALVLENNVTLNGRTAFFADSLLNTAGKKIINNGELQFAGKGKEINANMEGYGTLTIDMNNDIFVLKGKRDNDTIDYGIYSYLGKTEINGGTLKLSQAHFSNSQILGTRKGTKLILEDSMLSTTVSGGHINVDIDGESVWHNVGNSNIGSLHLHENGTLNLSTYPISVPRPPRLHHSPLANKLTINGDYSSNGGILTFYSKLEGDDSETDSMLVKGNTSGHTNVKINNLGGQGAKTDLGILLIEVKGESNGDFKQVGRIAAGPFDYFLRRGSEGDRKKNWYMISDVAIVDNQSMAEKNNSSSNNPHEVVHIAGKDYPANPIIQLFDKIIKEPQKNDNAVKPSSNPHEVVHIAGKDYPANPIIQLFDKIIKKPQKNDNEVKPSDNPHEVVNIAGKYSDKTIHEFLVATLPGILGLKEKEEAALANSSQTTAPTTEIKNKSENTSVDKSNIPPKDSNIVVTPNKLSVENNNRTPQKTYQPVYRPENGSYIANLSMARNLFTSDLDNRSGNYKYKDAATGEWRTSSMWIQTQGGIKQFGKTVDQLNIKGKYYSVQLGGDVAKWDVGTQGSGRIGMLAGMGKATNHSKSNITGYYSNGSVNGYNLGVYATWLTDQQNKTGLYIDTLAQYSWFNNAVNGQELAEEKYKSSGFTSSIESGYTFNIGSTEQLSYFIQPNAKITWVGINAQTHTATNKDIINYTNRGQLITRIGAKTYLQTTNNSEQQFMPFIAVNWLHQNHNTGTQLSGQGVENGSKNSAEFKIGVESKIDQRLHAWANINHQIGNYNTNDTNALVGIKYAF